MRFSVPLMCCLWTLTHVASADAQVAGVPVSCVDFAGRSVALVADPTLPDVGAARIVYGQPVILMNPVVLNRQTRELQLFWYAHECAHHALGHMVNPGPTNEAMADCWAVRTGRQQRWFPPASFQALAQVLQNSPGSIWGHLPGPARLRNMWSCYSQS